MEDLRQAGGQVSIPQPAEHPITGETVSRRRWYHPDGTTTLPIMRQESWQMEKQAEKGFSLNCPQCHASHGYHKATCPVLLIDPWKLVEPGSGEAEICLSCGKILTVNDVSTEAHGPECPSRRKLPVQTEVRGRAYVADNLRLRELEETVKKQQETISRLEGKMSEKLDEILALAGNPPPKATQGRKPKEVR